MSDSCERSSTKLGDRHANEDNEISQFREALPQTIAVSIKNLLLISYGMSLGFPTILIPAVQGGDNRPQTDGFDLRISKEEISWLSSINLICVPLGCLFSGSFTEHSSMGRRKAMQLVNIPITIAWLLFYFSTNVNYLYAGLCLTGLTGGLLEAPVLTYVAEITTPTVRGMLSATGSLCVILGVFIVFLLGLFFEWRSIALYSCFLPITALILLFFVPESPHWLIRKNRVDEAEKNLAWLRGWVPVEKVKNEFNELCIFLLNDQEAEAPKRQTYSLYARRGFLLPYFIISLCFFVGHFSGMTTLQTYAGQIFQILKAPIDKYYAIMLLGIVELAGTLTYVVLVHFTGKRPLVFFSTIGCGLCFLATAGYAHLIGIGVSDGNGTTVESQAILSALNHTSLHLEENWEELTLYFGNSSEPRPAVAAAFLSPQTENGLNSYFVWLPLVFLLGSAYISHVGIRLIPWMLIGEIYPSDVRSTASGVSGGTGYIFGFLANKLFLNMLDTMTLPGLFLFYAMVSFVGFLVLYFVMQETENRTLTDIELHYTGQKSLSLKEVQRADGPRNLNLQLDLTPEKFDIAQWESNKKFEAHLQQCIETRKIPAEVQNAVGLGVVRPTRKSVAAMGPTTRPMGRTKKHSLNLGLLAMQNPAFEADERVVTKL